jgi:type IV conjugative transfer system protein TraL
MEQTQIPIPIFLNEPDKIIFWTWFEVFLFLSLFFLVWILCSFLLGLLFGFVAIKLLRWMQKSPWGDLTTVGVYWFLPTQQSFKNLPPSYIREFMG